MSSVTNDGVQPPPIGICCRRCEDAAIAGKSARERLTGRRLIVCTTCGNKRCPKATQHDLDCTGSNATGQKESDYA